MKRAFFSSAAGDYPRIFLISGLLAGVVVSSSAWPAEPALRLEQKKKKREKNKAPIEASWNPDEERCWKMEKRLEKVEQHLRGYKASQ